jgi:hypothetical protein
MKRAIYLALAVCLAAWAPIAWGALADVDTSIGEDDVREINNATPGTSKTFLGTRLRGPLVQGATTYAAGDNGNPTGKCVSGASTFQTPTTTVFLKTTGAATGESYCLGNGQVGQQLTVVLATDGGKDFTVTPLTKSGFTDVLLSDVSDSVTMKYINSTVGWVVIGNAGATIQ